MNLGIISNINIEPLKEHFDTDLFDQIHFAGFNQIIPSLIDPQSQFLKQDSGYVLLMLEGEELLKDSIYDLNGYDFHEYLDPIFSAIEAFLKRNRTVTLIVSTISLPPFSFSTFILSDQGKTILETVENNLNDWLLSFAKTQDRMLILDFSRILKLNGYNSIYDDKYWYLGRIKFSHTGFALIGNELNNLISSHLGKSKKVLVLDLDNTLWGGIVGEDGIQGIKLSEDGTGKIYRDFQKAVLSLKKLGILLVVCSKNNESDAFEAFKSHPMMILDWEDFIIRKINWTNKAENIKQIANELNLGLNSFVFIDDNHVERKLIRDVLPMVSVPEFPSDIAFLKRWFINDVVYPHFPKYKISKEDKDKTQQYKKNIVRHTLSEKLNLDDFIGSLEISLKLFINPSDHITRLAQLTQKTNQFNTTTHRYVEKDIFEFLKNKDFDVYCALYEDKYGIEGVISEIIIDKREQIPNVDTFLMSCRVIGRNVEYSMLNEVLRLLENQGHSEVTAECIPTKKNVLVENLYKEIGLTELTTNQFTGNIAQSRKLLASKKLPNIEIIPEEV